MSTSTATQEKRFPVHVHVLEFYYLKMSVSTLYPHLPPLQKYFDIYSFKKSKTHYVNIQSKNSNLNNEGICLTFSSAIHYWFLNKG